MNALAVQNPHYKCDLGNKKDSVTTPKIWLQTIFDYYYNYYTLHSKSYQEYIIVSATCENVLKLINHLYHVFSTGMHV